MKQIKLFGVVALALTLGLAACSGKPKACDKHDWGEYSVVKAATCTEDGQEERTCKKCGEKQTKTIKASHTWGDYVVKTEATCTAVGEKERECSVCHQKQKAEIPMADHTYGEWETVTEADCDNAGSRVHACTVCGHEETETVDALGHDFKKDEQGAVVFNWTVEPTCEKAGVGTKHCERCGKDIDATEDESKKLGHDVEAIGGETTPTDGTAAVRLYKCKRCQEIYLGFLANEVTNESKAHVAFEPETVTEGQEQGARFLGRPIGNSIALDATGTSVNQQNGECLYCSTETGDFIEYAFNLNKEQAETLATCRMYCDAQPANYLNGTDFWAYSGSNDEWTPGYYIDGDDSRFETNEDGTFQMVKDHARAGFDSQPGAELETEVKKGKRIEDYRYVLYVDDEVKDFDETIENPTHGSNTNMQREEFVLPYTFHLHEGLNKIKFVMAGGYRSLFYKCIFRPYVEPSPITVNEDALEVREGKTVAITSSMEGLLFKSSSTSVATVDAKGVVTGVKAGKATITVSKEGNYKDVKIPVTVLEKEGLINIDLNGENNHTVDPEGSVDVYYSSYNQATRLRNWAKDGSITYKFASEVAGLYNIQLTGSQSGDMAETLSVKVNGKDVAVSGSLAGSTYSPVDQVIGLVELAVAEENTITIKNLAESSQLTINAIKLFPHEHGWELAEVQPTEGDTDAAVVKYVCAACGMVKYEIAAKTAKMQVAASSDWKTDPTTSSDGAFKLNNGKTATFTFALPGGFSGKMYQRCYMDSYSSNLNKKMFFETNNHSNIEVKVNNGDAIDLSRYATTTFKAVLGEELNGKNSLTKDIELGDVTLGTANTISYKRIETLNMLVTHFVFIGYEAQ